MQNHTYCICLAFLHCVFSHDSSNWLPHRMKSHTDCICWTLLHCVFWNAFSNRLHHMMQSCTGCICLIFLRCMFSNVASNVSSNDLTEWMLSHTGCMHLFFLPCAVSNVSSMHLDQCRQTYTGCICLTLPHHVLLDGPSSELRERMHNHKVYICGPFLHCVFFNESSNGWPW